MIKWRQMLPSFVTVLAMLAGFISILVTIQGMLVGVDIPEETNSWFRFAAQLIMLSMILDGIDGNLARMLKAQSDFGAELDTYVDLTAFGIAPAILVFAVALQSKDEIWRIILPSVVALSGMVRLARFKAKDPLRGQGGYAGLPITANAGWVALFVFISETPPLDSFSLNHGKVAVFFLMGIITFVVLQVTNFRYPKPTKKVALFVPCVILVGLLFVPIKQVPLAAAVVALFFGTAYVLFGPLFVKGVEVHRSRRDARRDRLQNGNE